MGKATTKRRSPRVAVIHNVDFLSRPGEDDAVAPPSMEADEEVAATAEGIASILRDNGMRTFILQVDDSLDGLLARLNDLRITAVFNLVESLGNDSAREPELPILLEKAKIPYTGNSPTALRLAHCKENARRLLTAHGLPVAAGLAVDRVDELTDEVVAPLAFPLFVKPAHTDASIGIDQNSVVRDIDALRARVGWLRQHIKGPVLVEEYLPGREINVAIFPDPFTGVAVPTEIDFSPYPPGYEPIVTYNCKWLPATPEYAAMSHPCADRLPRELYDEVRRLAMAAFLTLGGASYGRVDMRLDKHGRPHIIDVNPNNDLDREAGLAIAARSVGVDYAALVAAIMAGARVKEQHVFATGDPA
jgi:D-alanine-D-alanine ligase